MDPFRIVRRDESAERQDEAEQQWGNSERFREAQCRTRRYTPVHWAQIRLESSTIVEALGAAFRDGVPPDDPRAVALAERHRLHIDRWYYPCDRQTHLELAGLYTSDPRFAAGFESQAPGLAAYLSAAIAANAKAAP